jgi:hypothetical protein
MSLIVQQLLTVAPAPPTSARASPVKESGRQYKEHANMRKLKLLTLTAVALAAVSAVTAASAQAIAFHAASAPLAISTSEAGFTAKQKHQVFDAAGASITCTSVKGTATATSTEQAAIESTSIQYPDPGETGGSCTFVGQTATVTMNGCQYNFHANGVIDIEDCNQGKVIEFEVPNPVCKVTVGEQSGKKVVTYTNISSKTEIQASPNVTGISYTATGAGCPSAGSNTNGEYTTGNVIFRGAGGAAVWVE